MKGTQVQSLVWELRPNTPHSQKKKKTDIHRDSPGFALFWYMDFSYHSSVSGAGEDSWELPEKQGDQSSLS